jgi:hypothetical protein
MAEIPTRHFIKIVKKEVLTEPLPAKKKTIHSWEC